MKTVLWKPFRRWTGTLYSHFSSSYRDNRAKSSALHTTSQDPIVSSSLNGYQLQNMDLEKAQQSGRKQDLNILERAIAQLPGANHHNHPHHAPYKTADTSAGSTDNSKRLSQLDYPSGINKETTIHVSDAPRPEPQPQPKRLPSVTSRGPPQRPRHQPLIPYRQDDVTPRVWDEVHSSRHNAPASMAPSSPAPPTVSQNTTAPLTPVPPLSPSSLYSTDVDSQLSTRRTPKRHAGTFFFG
jgi:hypothetical protein